MTSTAVAEAAQRNIKEPGGITVASTLTWMVSITMERIQENVRMVCIGRMKGYYYSAKRAEKKIRPIKA